MRRVNHLDPHAVKINVFVMGYVTSLWVLCDTLSQCFISGASVYILCCLHLYSFESYDRPYALKIMSDVEDVIPANTDFSSSRFLPSSLPKQPSSQSLEASVLFQSSESNDIASAFSLIKDYFDKKLGALKRDIQDESCSNTDSVAKKLKDCLLYTSPSPRDLSTSRMPSSA